MLNEFYALIKKYNRSVLGFFIFFVLGSIFFSLSLDNIYRSKSLLLPPSSEEQTSTGINALSTLSNIGGINLSSITGGQSENIKVKLIRTIQSEDFLVPFVINNDLISFIFAFKKRDKNKVFFDEKVWDGKRIIDKNLLYEGNVSKFKIYEKISSMISISESFEDGTITLAVESKDREYSYLINQMILNDVDTFIRDKVIEKSQRRIEFLNKNSTNFINDLERENFLNLLAKEKIRLMNAEVSDFYSFQIIDKPDFPEEKSAPRRSLIVIFSTFLFMLFSIVNIIIRERSD